MDQKDMRESYMFIWYVASVTYALYPIFDIQGRPHAIIVNSVRKVANTWLHICLSSSQVSRSIAIRPSKTARAETEKASKETRERKSPLCFENSTTKGGEIVKKASQR